MANRYASTTDVSSSRSREEIERTLIRYGASGFAYGWSDDTAQAVIGFKMRDRQMRFLLPMLGRDDREFTHTPSRNTRRSPAQIDYAYEQAIKQRWRALSLVIKAKLEAVASEIVTFEDEWTMHMVLPNGRTVSEVITAEIEQAYATGEVRPMLAIGARK